MDITESQRFQFKGLDIIFVSERHSPVGVADVTWPDEDALGWANAKAPCLTIFRDEEKRSEDGLAPLVRAELRGPAAWRAACESVCESSLLSDDFEMRCAYGKDGCFFGAKIKNDHADWNRLLSMLMEFCFVEGRPVRSFKTDFIFPFTVRINQRAEAKEAGLKKDCLSLFQMADNDVETILYFLPHVRDLLFGHFEDGHPGPDTDIEPVRRYELKNRKFEIHVESGKEDIRLDVAHVRLFHFPNNHVYFLSICATLPEVETLNWGSFEQPLDFLNALTDNNDLDRLGRCQAYRCLAANHLVRRVYPTFWEQIEEEKIADVALVAAGVTIARAGKKKPLGDLLADLRPSLSPVVESIICEMMDIGKARIFPMLDDRMFVNSHMALWGDKPLTVAGKNAYDALFSLAMYVDKAGSPQNGGYWYDPGYIKKRAEHNVFRLWEGPFGNVYGFTDFSNVYVGYGGAFEGFLSRHIHNHYFYMILLALHNRVSMIDFTERLARATKRWIEPENLGGNDNTMIATLKKRFGSEDRDNKKQSKENIRALKRDFAIFTNQYRYREITAQMQGIEIYGHQCGALHIDHVYDEFKEELGRTDSLVQMNWQDEISTLSRKISQIGFVLSIILACIGLLDKDMWVRPTVFPLLVIVLLYVWFKRER